MTVDDVIGLALAVLKRFQIDQKIGQIFVEGRFGDIPVRSPGQVNKAHIII